MSIASRRTTGNDAKEIHDSYKLTNDRRGDECRNCPLCKNELRVVATEYHGKRPRIMFIAEAPGREENGRGRPAIGVTGQILRRLVRRLNDGTEAGVAYGNVVRCRPTKQVSTESGAISASDRKPSEAEIGYCRHYIYRDIERLDPQYIVLLGDVATHALAVDPQTGEEVDKSKGIHVLRGKDYEVRTPSGKVYPATSTFHFAYISRSLNEGGVFYEDIQKALWRTRSDYPDYRKRGKPAVVLDTVTKVKKLLHKLRYGLTKDDIVALDFECAGLERINTTVLCIGFAYGPNRGYVIPFEHKDTPWDARDLRRVRRLLSKFFGAKEFSFGAMVAHNLKFEAAVIMDKFGVVPLDVPWECTQLRAFALNENRGGTGEDEDDRKGSGGHALKTLCEEWLSFYLYHDKDIAPTVELRNSGKLSGLGMAQLAEYNAMDCYVEWRLYHYERYYAERCDYAETFLRLSRKLLGPSSIFASWLERNGMGINKGRLRFLMGAKSPIVGALRRIEREMYAKPSVKRANQRMLGMSKNTTNLRPLWGGNSDSGDAWVFSISKPVALRALLLDELHLTGSSRARGKDATKTGQWRINQAFYKRFADVPEVALISEWKLYDKLHGTYIRGIYDQIQGHPDMRCDGRIRGRLNLGRAVTGRTSFSDPNLQNIPSHGREAKSIKRLFRAMRRKLLVCGDYSQAEVRWLAEITHDLKLISEFKNAWEVIALLDKSPSEKNALKAKLEGDFHRRTASQMFRIDLDQVTKQQRTFSKEVVFGNIYGMGARSLAQKISVALKSEVSQEQAAEFQAMFFAQFPDAAKWLHSIERKAYRDGYVESPFGRRRHLLSHFLVPKNVSRLHWKNSEGHGASNSLSPQEKDLEMFLGQEDRQARNSPIQGVASDTNLLACIRIMRYIVENNKDWMLVNVVHDSVVAEIPEDEVEEYTAVAKGTMQDASLFTAFDYAADTPFVADFSLGPNWGDQLDILPLATWQVTCKSMIVVKKEVTGKKGKTRVVREKKVCGDHDVYGKRPRCCPSCGKDAVEVELVGGPVPLLLRHLAKEKARAS